MPRVRSFLPLLAVVVLTVSPLAAQTALRFPKESQHAETRQTIGLTDLAVSYHSPRVRERTIWGALVPWGEIWRAGANENTVFTTSERIAVEGVTLEAGSYGLHMIPGEQTWTVIFSRNSTSWGSYTYDPAEDAARVSVRPRSIPFQEWLSYDFTDRGDSSVTLELRWETLAVPVRIAVPVTEVVLGRLRLDLRSLAGFTSEGWKQAAAYCLVHRTNVEEALRWIDRAIAMQQSFAALSVKSGLLELRGDGAGARDVMELAYSIAAEEDFLSHGNAMLTAGRLDRAREVFERMLRRFPRSWSAYDRMAETCERRGELRLAAEYHAKARDVAGDERRRARSADALGRVRSKLNTTH